MDLGRARKILNVAHSAFISMDDEGRVTYWNIRAEETFGWTREQAVGQNVIELIVPERYREALREGFRRFKAGGDTRLAGPAHRADRAARRRQRVPRRSDRLGAAGGRDATPSTPSSPTSPSAGRREAERQRLLDELERALAGTEQRLQAIVDSLAEAITIRAPDNRLVYANRAALERLGMSSLERARGGRPARADGQLPRASTRTAARSTMDDLPSVRLLRGEDARAAADAHDRPAHRRGVTGCC